MITGVNITSVHVNSKAKILHEIFGQAHWLDQLKSAVLFRDRYSAELSNADRQIKAQQRLIKEIKREIDALDAQLETGANSEIIQDKIAACKDKLEEINEDLEKVQPVVRDTEYLLKVAIDAEERILSLALATHPEIENLSYEEVQHRFAQEAFNAQLARLYARYVLTSQAGLTPEVADEFLKLPPSEITAITTSAESLLRGIGVVPSLPSEQQNAN